MSGFWILLIILALLLIPLLIGMLRSAINGNSNRFYGDELNKQKPRTRKDKAFDKASLYYDSGGNGGDGGETGDDS